jgi:hypothetical protein
VKSQLNDVWANYFYNGSIWLNTDGKTPLQQAQLIDSLAGNMGNATPGSFARGSMNCANVTMETFTQTFETNINQINVNTFKNFQTGKYLQDEMSIQWVNNTKDILHKKSPPKMLKEAVLVGFPDYNNRLEKEVIHLECLDKDHNVFTRRWPLSQLYYPERRALKIFREMFGVYTHKYSLLYKRGDLNGL